MSPKRKPKRVNKFLWKPKHIEPVEETAEERSATDAYITTALMRGAK